MNTELIVGIASSTVLAAIVTTILAPRVNWGFEKKRALQQNRKDLISDVRKCIGTKSFSRVAFIRTDEYNRIRPHLSPGLNKQIMENALVLVVPSPVLQLDADDYLKMDIGKELHQLEVKWELI